MASLRKFPRSKYWFGCVTMPDGRRVQRSTKESSRKKAQAKADQWEALSKSRARAKQAHRVIADIYRAAHQSDLPSTNARAFLEGYIARRKTETSKATFEAYENRVKNFLAFLGPRAEQPLTDITREDVQRFRDEELDRVSPVTVNQSVKILRIMFEDARRDSLIADNPAKDVRTLKVSAGKGKRRPFKLSELRAVLALADEEWRSMIYFGLYTGQRLADIGKLTWQNLDLGAGEIRLVTSKTGRIIAIPICQPLLKFIEENVPASDDPKAPLHPKAFQAVESQGRAVTLSTQFGDLLAQAGLAAERKHTKIGQGRSARRASSELSFHSLRHTATSLMKNAGVSSAIVQDIIGHDSAEVSAHYTHIDSAAKRKALDRMPDLSLRKRKPRRRRGSEKRRKNATR